MATPKSKKRTLKKKKPAKVTSRPAALPGWFTNRRLHVCLLFGFSFLLYANTLSHEYAQDDAIVIYDNMFTKQGVSGIPGILKNDTFYGFFQEEGKAKLVSGGRYRPLSLVLFAVEVQLFGQKPFIGHLINTLFYGLTVVVLYLVLLQLFLPVKDKANAFFIALGASLLFAAHPLHVEAVANIKGRDEILSLLGSLAALYYSLRAYREGRPVFNTLAAALFFLALLSKENAITFLAIMPLSYYFFTKANSRKIISHSIPFVLAAGVFLAIRSSILGFSLGEPSLELMNNPFVKVAGSQYVAFTPGEKMATIMYTLGKYVQLFVFPHPLTHDYYPRHIPIMNWGNWQVLLSLLFHLLMLAYAIRRFFKKDPLSYAILFYLLTFSIVSNVLFPVGTNMAERLVFMPSVGLCLLLALLAWRLAERGGFYSFRQLYPLMGLLIMAVMLFSARTISRNAVWKNNFTLFSHDIRHSPNSAKLRNALGGELITQSVVVSNEDERKRMLKEAEGHLREAIRIHPNYKNAYLLLGNCYNYLQQFENSIQSYQKALTIDPNYEDASNNLGITYRNAGRYYGEQKGDLVNSLKYLNLAYQAHPDEYETVRLLGVAYGIQGNTAKALAFFNKGIEMKPQDADAWFNLGNAYFNAGDPEKGNECHRKALQIDPEVAKKRGVKE